MKARIRALHLGRKLFSAALFAALMLLLTGAARITEEMRSLPNRDADGETVLVEWATRAIREIPDYDESTQARLTPREAAFVIRACTASARPAGAAGPVQ